MDDIEIVKYVATRALCGVICKNEQHTDGVHYVIFTTLYEFIVQHVIFYAAGLWDNQTYTKLNAVQNRAYKYVLGLTQRTSNVAFEGDI